MVKVYLWCGFFVLVIFCDLLKVGDFGKLDNVKFLKLNVVF